MREQVYKEALGKIANSPYAEGDLKLIAQSALLQGKDECPEKELMRGKCCNKNCVEYSSYSNDCMKSYDWKIRLCPIYVQWEEGTGLKTPEEPLFMQAIHKNSKTPEHCEIEPYIYNKGYNWKNSELRMIEKINELVTAVNKLSGKG
jgi:hypothetical protein